MIAFLLFFKGFKSTHFLCRGKESVLLFMGAVIKSQPGCYKHSGQAILCKEFAADIPEKEFQRRIKKMYLIFPHGSNNTRLIFLTLLR
ncbi:MAG: hypothetical protein A2W90_01135 [Bacteroidetes bacterium GWF2_42_66]|nr:MAG: hypothetical protein A2W92_00555 [Bacteroidetes bacterium GWA2_42_15]OFY00984.1 MAG: hypothetical protein A2W89_14625 [Bacteroidetes bacterium GWE2_42_39]OFY41824.1 MAG: hypothetical protein A2W90_01135 [Bacteroidetes bacterium GWF2_42_66]HBL78005.1 hypothetical protein [Prolixibacteraceae bacterium]HCR90232.1 hypothetical protein [Prolixibacteraceae bacterium]